MPNYNQTSSADSIVTFFKRVMAEKESVSASDPNGNELVELLAIGPELLKLTLKDHEGTTFSQLIHYSQFNITLR